MTRAHLGYWAARQPDAEAAVFVDPDPARPVERISYGTLDAAANRLAQVLRRAGLQRDDRVAFVLGNERPSSPSSGRRCGRVCTSCRSTGTCSHRRSATSSRTPASAR